MKLSIALGLGPDCSGFQHWASAYSLVLLQYSVVIDSNNTSEVSLVLDTLDIFLILIFFLDLAAVK